MSRPALLLPFIALGALVLACGGDPHTAEPAEGAAPRVCGYEEENTAKLFLCIEDETAELPFSVITAWSSKRFLEDRGVFATFIRGPLESNYGEFIDEPANLDLNDDDIIMLEFAFEAETADVELSLLGEGGNFKFRTSEVADPSVSVDIAPSAWVEILADDPVDGELGWIEESEFTRDGLGIREAGDTTPLTLAVGEKARRVWVPFFVPERLSNEVGALVYDSPSGEQTVLQIFEAN